ncbi:MAG TPA: SBBP repeat-containing protein, partial [Bryobacteraceae bacterium]
TTKIGGPPTSSTAPVAFVSRLSADGTHLIYSLFLGGAANTFVNSTTIQALAVDSAGAAYVTGNTGATDFPITPGAFQSARPQSTCNRPQANILVITSLPGDAFVTKISPDGSQLQYSTRVTGSCGSVGQSIAVDPSGEAVLAGYTPSSDLPVSTGSYQSTFPGDPSQINPPNALTVGFAAKLSAAGDRLLAGTYLGGSYSSQASAVTLDPTGNIYLSGQSGKLVPGATPGAYQAKVTDTCAYPISIGPSLPYGGANDAFILKLDPTLSTAAFMTYLGGGCNDAGSSIALDSARNIWLLGNSQSVDFPLKSPFQSGNASSQFLSELSADGSQLLFSTVTDGIAFAIDRSGAVNLVGPGVTSTIPKNAQAIGPIGASIEWVRINPATSPSVVIDGIAPVTAFLPTVLAPYYPGKSIVPGELIQITGRNLGPPTQINGQLDATGRMPFSLAGITVLFDNIPAPLVSVSATSITCFAPFEIRSSTNLTVQSNARKSNTVRVGVLPSDMQILSVNNQDGTPNSAANPAHAGDIVVFYASGLGLTSPLSADGLINAPPLAVPALPVMVYLPRLTSPPDFVGAAPGQIAGIMQINVRLPATAPPANPLSIGFNTTSAPVYVQ